MRVHFHFMVLAAALACAATAVAQDFDSPVLVEPNAALQTDDADDASTYFITDEEPAPAAPAPAANAACACDDACATCGGCAPACGCCASCCQSVGSWFDNTLITLGAEGYKSVGDTFPPPGLATGYMASAGFVGGFNTGFSVGLDKIRGQIGGSYGIYDVKGRDTASPSSAEQQYFLTAGLYKRSDVLAGDRASWGVVYDQFWDHQWGLFADELYVGQFRGIAGWAMSEWNEIGVWGALHSTVDYSTVAYGPGPVRAMNQYNMYWRHNYNFGGQTMLYFGGVDPADVGSWQLGGTGLAPLGDWLAMYGNCTFAFPSSSTGPVGSNELQWNFGAGLVMYLGGKAVSPTVSGYKGLPLLPVANNGSMLITN